MRSTLTRSYRGDTRPRDAVAAEQQNINPQKEEDFLKNIEELNERRLPPKRDMIRNFASSVAQKEVSDSRVTHFINKHYDRLWSQWNSAIDSLHHNANWAESYRLYLNFW